MRRPSLHVCLQIDPFRLETPRLFPRLIIDNAKMRSVDGLPLVKRVWPGDPFPGVRILDHSDLVPDDTTDIEVVENQSRTPLRVAIDGRRIPSLATRRTNTFAIEIVRNIALAR